MTSAAWDWLPDSALTDTHVTATIDQALANWSGRWFMTYTLQRQRLERAAPTDPSVGSWRSIRVHASEKATTRLTGHALDLNLDLLEVTDDDKAVLDAFSQGLIQTLAEGLAQELSGSTPISEGAASGEMHLQLCDPGGDKVMTIAIPKAMLAAARRRAFPARKPVTGRPLTSYRTSLGPQEVSLSARLGQASLTLADTRNLAVGDVVVLNRRLDEPLDFVFYHSGAVVACASLVDAASPRSLRLEPARSAPQNVR